MAEQGESCNQLPPGWECRYDGRSGRAYFINHFNRSTTWEDPRVRYWQYAQYLQSQNSTTPSSITTDHPSESLPLLSSGSTAIGHITYSGAHRVPQVYPTPTPYSNPQLAFLPPSLKDLKTPISTRSVSGLTNRLGDLTIGSPTPIRTENSLIQNTDIELQVAKINTMFPTVSDTHIRLLLKKYHNRPALVVSALQVEKNPLCQPGPCTPIGVHSSYSSIPRWHLPAQAIHAALTLSPPIRGLKPITPHSPKMKLRYLKGMFPKVDEYILLDSLEQSDNNVQKATDRLLEMGYEKRTSAAPSRCYYPKKPEKLPALPPAPTPTPPPRMKSIEEKNKMKNRLMRKFEAVPEKVIWLALDSVDYDEDRAAHILDIMIAEEAIKPLNTSSSQSSNRSDDRKDHHPVTEALKLTASPIKRITKNDVDIEKSKRPKTKSEVPKVSRGTSTAEDNDYKSPYLTRPMGPNPDLIKGADNDILLPDYAPWSGPDPSNLLKNTYTRSVACGKDTQLANGTSNLAKGSNSELRKGPLRGLAQGSIYSQRISTGVESRGRTSNQTNS
ncbi:uncharacterized protein LOC106657220 isoform X1 [Trichogramma pretiosum]|uniref:uncharacterized protein LOC106657220 isoform X1 n=1 Tax=Trichogramma pretiosum TaxID=7493 RepID=UPI0006C97314|nr:uncharacterized protein LOC106657220 isoform X1 [Trichogramma pretiosum]